MIYVHRYLVNLVGELGLSSHSRTTPQPHTEKRFVYACVCMCVFTCVFSPLQLSGAVSIGCSQQDSTHSLPLLPQNIISPSNQCSWTPRPRHLLTITVFHSPRGTYCACATKPETTRERPNHNCACVISSDKSTRGVANILSTTCELLLRNNEQLVC